MVDDSFLTPWHAVLYAGAAAFGLTLGLVAARNLARKVPWRNALPGPYLLSLAAAVGFLVAGQLDFVWHESSGSRSRWTRSSRRHTSCSRRAASSR